MSDTFHCPICGEPYLLHGPYCNKPVTSTASNTTETSNRLTEEAGKLLLKAMETLAIQNAELRNELRLANITIESLRARKSIKP